MSSHENSVIQESIRPESIKKFIIGSLLIALIGSILSIYSINHHLDLRLNGETDAVCNINALYSCDDVARSEYSEVMGMPLGVLGLGFFVALAILSIIMLKNQKNRVSSYYAYWIIS